MRAITDRWRRECRLGRHGARRADRPAARPARRRWSSIPETDFVEERFAAGATLWTRSDGAATSALTIDVGARLQNGRPIVGFDGFATDRGRRAAGRARAAGSRRGAAAARRRGRTTSTSWSAAWWRRPAGDAVGEVAKVDGGAGGSRAGDRRAAGRGADSAGRRHLRRRSTSAARRIAIAPPEGLLELNETKARRGRRATLETERRMKFDIVTIFPRMIEAGLAEGVVSRGIEQRAARRRRCTTCATSRPTGIAAWTTCRTAAGRAW